MFEDEDRARLRRRGSGGIWVWALALLVLIGLAFVAAPRVTQLAATETPDPALGLGPNEYRGAETTAEATSRSAKQSAESTMEPDSEPPEPGSGRSQRAAGENAKGVERTQARKEQSGGTLQKEDRGETRASRKPEKQPKPDPPVPSDKTMSLTIPRLAAVRGDTVLNSDSPEALDRAAIKLPSTGFPWQEGANTYIAGHRIGWPRTETRYQFYYLPAVRKGDAVYLTDANGTTYEYRVTEKFAVKPSENWVTDPIAGRDMVTLQTCTETVNDWWTIGPKLMRSGPDSGRLIVRADKVATYPA